MYGKLIPQTDAKQKLRTTRALQAMGGGVIQSLVAVILFFFDGFRIEMTGFMVFMACLWVGHITLFLMIRLGLNRRIDDPSMTRELVVWSVITLLVTIFFMNDFRPMMMMFFPIVLTFGAFRMTAGQYSATAFLIVSGYLIVISLIYKLYPNTIVPEYEIVIAVVFVLIIIAVSVVSNQVSRLRKKLHQRNAELAGTMKKMEQMAVTDDLTGVPNRRHMMLMLNQQKAIGDRGSICFCVCFFDLDRFKNINDTLGHHVGDVVLQHFASTVQSQLRAADLLARFGGEEFVFMATGADLEGAGITADRIRKTIETLRFPGVNPSLTVTVSGGVAQFRQGEPIESVLSRADKALYLAKSSGRNCIKLETDLS